MSQHENFRLLDDADDVVECSCWIPMTGPRAIVQIAHGMGEHIGRYGEAARHLSASGLAVFGNDHRGHGRAIKPETPVGDFGDGGFRALVGDMRTLTIHCRELFPGLPLILLGHSMGSFAAQLFVLEDSSDLSALILSGSGALDQLAASIVGSKVPLDVSLNAALGAVRTPFDWLSRDDAAVDAFIADPLCFAELTPRSAQSVIGSAAHLSDPAALAGLRQDLPIFLLSGSCDPIGQQGVGVELLADRYLKAGLSRVETKLYEGARHELLHELNRLNVIEDLICWIDGVIDR